MKGLGKKIDISVFYPSYNEEKNIEALINSTVEVMKDVANSYEIVVVQAEAATDSTIAIVKKLMKKNRNIKMVIQKRGDGGYGTAFKMGWTNTKYDHIFYTDADNQFDIQELKKLLPQIDGHDMVVGYRVERKDPKMRIFISNIYKGLA